MLAITVFGHYAQILKDRAVMETWLSKQSVLIQQSNNIRQKETELNQLKDENTKLKKQVALPIQDRVIAEIKAVFGVKAPIALAVASCENSPYNKVYNPLGQNHANKNKSFDAGVFQINSIHIKRFGEAFINDWHENIRVAYQLFTEQGTNPWYSSEKCWKDKVASL